MSYTLEVLGYGFSRKLETDSPLREALGDLDAKFTSNEFGSFLQELGGMKYREVDGGFYSWVIRRGDGYGQPSWADEGVNMLRPRDGEHIYVQYEFFPSAQPREPLEPVPDELDFPEPDIPEYSPTPKKDYSRFTEVDYNDFPHETEEEQDTLQLPGWEEDERPVLHYSGAEATFEQPLPELYQVVLPRPVPEAVPVPDFRGDRKLERFLMDVLSGARFESLLSSPVEEEAPAPLVRV